VSGSRLYTRSHAEQQFQERRLPAYLHLGFGLVHRFMFLQEHGVLGTGYTALFKQLETHLVT
jgi:hypothetical protein